MTDQDIRAKALELTINTFSLMTTERLYSFLTTMQNDAQAANFQQLAIQKSNVYENYIKSGMIP